MPYRVDKTGNTEPQEPTPFAVCKWCCNVYWHSDGEHSKWLCKQTGGYDHVYGCHSRMKSAGEVNTDGLCTNYQPTLLTRILRRKHPGARK